jgi:hypothetical protein
VWRLQRPGAPAWWYAPGLATADGGPPEGRDASLAQLAESAARLAAWVAADGPRARLLGDQGPPLDAAALALRADYWRQLLAVATAAVQRGDDETAPALPWPGLPAAWAEHPRHRFNWQHAWREVEPAVLAAPPPAGPPSGRQAPAADGDPTPAGR